MAPAKSLQNEVILFRTAKKLGKIVNTDLALHAISDIIELVSVMYYLGVLLDQELSMKQHISNVM